jgi:hypothetical protein
VVSFIGGGNWSTRSKRTNCRKSLTNFITKCCIEYTSPWTGFELTTLVVIGTDWTGSYKSNYDTFLVVSRARRQFVRLLRVLQFPPPIKLTTRI